MKLAELNTDQALDVLCELTPSVSKIIEDDEVLDALSDAMPEKGDENDENSSFKTGIRMFAKIGTITPVLLKKHRADVYHILSVLDEMTVEEIAGQPVTVTLRQAREAFRDSDLLVFFKSFVQRERTEQSAPSVLHPASE